MKIWSKLWQKLKKQEGEQIWYMIILSGILEFVIWVLILIIIKTFIFQPFRIFGESMSNTLRNSELIIINKIIYNDLFKNKLKRGDVIVLQPPLERVKKINFKIDSTGSTTIYLPQRTSNEDNIKLKLSTYDQTNPQDFQIEILQKGRNSWLVNHFKRLLNVAFYDRIRISGPRASSAQIVISETSDFYIKRIIGLPNEYLQIKNGEVYIDRKMINEPYLDSRNRHKTYLPIGTISAFRIPNNSYFVMGDNRNNSIDSRECFDSCKRPLSTNFVPKKNVVGKTSFVFWPLNKLGTNIYNLDYQLPSLKPVPVD